MIEKSYELRKLEILESRLPLNEETLHYKKKLLKGFEGEYTVIERLKSYREEIIFLHDLYLSGTNTSHIQIDILLITRGHAFLIEVKNYEGSHTSKGDFLQNQWGFEFQNPKNQVLKAQSTLLSIFKEEGFSSYSIEPLVVYPHGSFKLYNASSQDLHYSLDNLEHYILKNVSIYAGITLNDQKLANTIMNKTKTFSHNNDLIPNYKFEELEKKVNCPECRHSMEEYTKRLFKCGKCSLLKSKSEVLEYNILEYQLLFNTLPTYTELHSWIANSLSLKSCTAALTAFRRKVSTNIVN